MSKEELLNGKFWNIAKFRTEYPNDHSIGELQWEAVCDYVKLMENRLIAYEILDTNSKIADAIIMESESENKKLRNEVKRLKDIYIDKITGR